MNLPPLITSLRADWDEDGSVVATIHFGKSLAKVGEGPSLEEAIGRAMASGVIDMGLVARLYREVEA